MTNKLLLTTIAIGLWANVLAPWIKPSPARADMNTDNLLSAIATDIHAIARGGRGCTNLKICD